MNEIIELEPITLCMQLGDETEIVTVAPHEIGPAVFDFAARHDVAVNAVLVRALRAA